MVASRACVLVAIDFSEGSLGAVRKGRWLAERAALGLQVLHVTEDGTPWEPSSLERDWLRSAPVDSGSVLVRHGQPWVEIVRHAHEVSAAMVVLGSHGASGAQPMTLGTTASRVALRAPCPVLFVSHRQDLTRADDPSGSSLHP